MIEADADQQRRAARAGELRWLQLDDVRIVLRRGEAFDFHARATNRLSERLEVRRRRDDAQLLLREDVSWRRRKSERQDQRPQHYERFWPVKSDFGIMQCTPLRISTTCETRQSPAIDTNAYAS